MAGNGAGAFMAGAAAHGHEGGAQDGAAKAAFGGRLCVLKGVNHLGEWVDGAVGKGFAYGAMGGASSVQGNADSRFCVRLSGADVVAAGEIAQPLDDKAGFLAIRANLKGFAFEYMTAGRAVVLGDPGPWMCAGMTGGVVYQRLQPDKGMDLAALRRRIARGARVQIGKLDAADQAALREPAGRLRRGAARRLPARRGRPHPGHRRPAGPVRQDRARRPPGRPAGDQGVRARNRNHERHQAHQEGTSAGQ